MKQLQISKWFVFGLSLFLLCALALFVLAEIGHFHPYFFVPICILIFLVLLFIIPDHFILNIPFSKLDFAVLGFIIIAAAVYLFPPSEYILGGWDPGVYTLSGIKIAKQGSINFSDELLKNLSPQERSVFVSIEGSVHEFYPGFRIKDSHEGNRIYPQFLHLYPTCLGTTYYLGGIKGSLMLNPLLSLLCIFMLYLLSQTMLGPPWALLGALCLALNPVQIWMARFQNAEILAQFFFIVGFVFLFLGSSKNSSLNIQSIKQNIWLHILSALSLWLAILTHYSFFMVNGILIGLGFLNMASTQYRSPHFWPRTCWLFVMILGMIHALLHQRLIAPLYTPLSHIIRPFLTIVISSSIFIAIAVKIFKKNLFKYSYRLNMPLRYFSVLIFILSVIYAIFFRTHLTSLSWDRFNFVHLASFITWPVILLASLGIVVMILKSATFPAIAFSLIGLLISYLTIHKKFIDPFYLWAARRFIPVIFPFIFISAATGVKQVYLWIQARSFTQHLPQKIRKVIPLTTVFFFSILYMTCTHPMRSELQNYRDFQGLTSFFKEMGPLLPKADLIVTQERGVAEILHFHYDLPAVYVRNITPEKLLLLEDVLTKRLKKRQQIFILTQNIKLFEAWTKIRLEPVNSFQWNGKILNQSKSGFPKGSKERGFDLSILKAHLIEKLT